MFAPSHAPTDLRAGACPRCQGATSAGGPGGISWPNTRAASAGGSVWPACFESTGRVARLCPAASVGTPIRRQEPGALRPCGTGWLRTHQQARDPQEGPEGTGSLPKAQDSDRCQTPSSARALGKNKAPAELLALWKPRQALQSGPDTVGSERAAAPAVVFFQ